MKKNYFFNKMKLLFVDFSKGLLTEPIDVKSPVSTKDLWIKLFDKVPQWSERLNKKITLVRKKNGAFKYRLIHGSRNTEQFAVLACVTRCAPKYKMVSADSDAVLSSIFKSVRKVFRLSAGAYALAAGVVISGTGFGAKSLMNSKTNAEHNTTESDNADTDEEYSPTQNDHYSSPPKEEALATPSENNDSSPPEKKHGTTHEVAFDKPAAPSGNKAISPSSNKPVKLHDNGGPPARPDSPPSGNTLKFTSGDLNAAIKERKNAAIEKGETYTSPMQLRKKKLELKTLKQLETVFGNKWQTISPKERKSLINYFLHDEVDLIKAETVLQSLRTEEATGSGNDDKDSEEEDWD